MMSKQQNSATLINTLLFIPNIVDYVRIVLLITSGFYYYSSPLLFLSLYILSACLDGVDGYLARKLNQVSAFGAWLDVVVDNYARAMLWCRLTDFGFVVTSLEWLTFVCNHTQGTKWKAKIVGPWFVRKVMENNFRTALGFLAVGSLNVLPLWLYCLYHDVIPLLLIPSAFCALVTVVLVIGRVLCAAVEVWCIYVHIYYLCVSPGS